MIFRKITLLVLLVIVSVGGTPFTVSADTQSEQQIRAQIIELEAKLTQLKAQLVASQQNTTSSLCTAGITTTFRVGSQSRDVAVLQQFLIAKGFLSSKATGYYGPVTAIALANYQASVGIRESGFGQITQTYINKILCPSTIANPSYVAPNTSSVAPSFKMREIWTTGYSFKVGDTMGLNLSPAAIPVGYTLYIEAWDANDSTKVADIKKIECTTGTECAEVISWRIPTDLMRGDQQFVIRATLKKGDIGINTVRTGRIYVIGYDRYTSESLVPSPTLNATGVNTTAAPAAAPDYNAPLPALTFSLSGDKVHFSQTEQITLNLKAYNNTDVPITLNFNSGCPRVVYVVGGYSRTSTIGPECTTNLGTSSIVKPKSSYTWQVIHNPSVYKIPVGNQKIEASVNASNKSEYPGVGWNVALPITIYSADNTSSAVSAFEVWKTFIDMVY